MLQPTLKCQPKYDVFTSIIIPPYALEKKLIIAFLLLNHITLNTLFCNIHNKMIDISINIIDSITILSTFCSVFY